MRQGTRVFITGGSSGIGKRLAADCLKRGAHVTIAANDPERLARAHQELCEIAPLVESFVCDVADPRQVHETAARYVATFGAPDVLVNNAGYAVYQTCEQMPAEELDRLLRVNLGGACLVTREFLPSMIAAHRGHVVMLASIAGLVPMTPCGPYSAAKHGLVAFSHILRAEVERFGVRVHVVCPGRVKTEFFAHVSFASRAPRRETEWLIPIDAVTGAVLDAIERNRFMTYVPRTYGVLVWLTRALPLLSGPMLHRLLRARVESVYGDRIR
jgi:short-subunit dehydrogenase